MSTIARTKKAMVMTMSVFMTASLMNTTMLTAAQSCNAGSPLGGTCSVNCGGGETAVCSGGLFVAKCTCDKASSAFMLSDVKTESIGLARKFVDFLRAHGSQEAAMLSQLAQASINAVERQNQDAYNSAETNFAGAYANISQELSHAIKQWQQENGIG